MSELVLTLDYGWNSLVLQDSEDFSEPPALGLDKPIAAAPSTLLIRTRLPQDGPITGRFLDAESEEATHCVFDGELLVPSGLLVLSETVRTDEISVRVPPGVCKVRVLVDEIAEPALVDVVVDAEF